MLPQIHLVLRTIRHEIHCIIVCSYSTAFGKLDVPTHKKKALYEVIGEFNNTKLCEIKMETLCLLLTQQYVKYFLL